MGQVLARDWKSYQYLVESIRQFPNQVKFLSISLFDIYIHVQEATVAMIVRKLVARCTQYNIM